MTNRKLIDAITDNKPLMLAIVVSIILHFVLLGGFLFNLPKVENKQSTLIVSLVKLPVAPLDRTKSADEHTPNPPIQQAETLPEPIPATLPEPVNLAPKDEIKGIEPPALQPATETDPVPAIVSDTTAPTPIEPSPAVSTQTNNIEVLANPYPYIETDFEVYQSSDPSKVSTNKVVFSTQGKKGYNQTYQLENGLSENASISGTEVAQNFSNGTISNRGLRPKFYKANHQQANFSWSDGFVEINKKLEKLPRGAQDELSYMYQFMFSPPTENTEIVIANGTQLETYHFSHLGEELILTKFGEIKTVHLLKEGNEKIDLWLAIEYQYIPIKVRKTGKDGSFTEQVATKLSTTLPDIEKMD